VSMCRCGESGNKPFCDSAHRDAGFEAESVAK
jgi:CDGSH-type Zn-finger protein